MGNGSRKLRRRPATSSDLDVALDHIRIYRDDYGPLAPWRAWQICRQYGHPMPDWVIDSLDAVASRLCDGPRRGEPPSPRPNHPEHWQRALGSRHGLQKAREMIEDFGDREGTAALVLAIAWTKGRRLTGCYSKIPWLGKDAARKALRDASPDTYLRMAEDLTQAMQHALAISYRDARERMATRLAVAGYEAVEGQTREDTAIRKRIRDAYSDHCEARGIQLAEKSI